MIYSYNDPGGDLDVIALNIENGGLAIPNGMERTDGQIGIMYTTALTDPQKATLDSLITPTVGQIPTTANSVYTLDDIMDLRAQLATTLAASGISFKIYPSSASQYKIIFNKVLSTQDKTTVKNAFLAFLKQIQ